MGNSLAADASARRHSSWPHSAYTPPDPASASTVLSNRFQVSTHLVHLENTCSPSGPHPVGEQLSSCSPCWEVASAWGGHHSPAPSKVGTRSLGGCVKTTGFQVQPDSVSAWHTAGTQPQKSWAPEGGRAEVSIFSANARSRSCSGSVQPLETSL